MEKAEKLIAIIDTNNKGVIDFYEFCRFIVLLKQGDERSLNYSCAKCNS